MLFRFLSSLFFGDSCGAVQVSPPDFAFVGYRSFPCESLYNEPVQQVDDVAYVCEFLCVESADDLRFSRFRHVSLPR